MSDSEPPGTNPPPPDGFYAPPPTAEQPPPAMPPPPIYGQPQYGQPAPPGSMPYLDAPYGSTDYYQGPPPPKGHKGLIAAAVVVVLVVAGIGIAAVSGAFDGCSSKVVGHAGDQVIYKSCETHVTVQLPETPTYQKTNADFGGVHFALHFDVVRSPLTEVGDEDISQATSTLAEQTALNSAISSFGASGQFTLSTPRHGSFRSYADETASGKDQLGQRLDVLTFFTTDQRLYFLVASPTEMAIIKRTIVFN